MRSRQYDQGSYIRRGAGWSASAARRSSATAGQLLDHSAEQVHVRLAQLGTGEDQLERPAHAGSAIGGPEEVHPVEFDDQVFEQLVELALSSQPAGRINLPPIGNIDPDSNHS